MRSSFTTLLLLLLSLLAIECKKDNDPTPEPLPSKIGDEYQGGVVFYIDPSGQHGLIAAPFSQDPSLPWWNGTLISTGATSTSDGKANTAAIVTAQGISKMYAARVCKEYTGGGFIDWYLPSKDEAKLMYDHRDVIGNVKQKIYWTSSEYEPGTIWVQDFSSGGQFLDSSTDAAGVEARAIRQY